MTKHKMVSARMFWDRSGDTWSAYGVPGQPAALLIRNGVVVKSWTGVLNEDAVEAALDK